jgi:hypothetical protein
LMVRTRQYTGNITTCSQNKGAVATSMDKLEEHLQERYQLIAQVRQFGTTVCAVTTCCCHHASPFCGTHWSAPTPASQPGTRRHPRARAGSHAVDVAGRGLVGRGAVAGPQHLQQRDRHCRNRHNVPVPRQHALPSDRGHLLRIDSSQQQGTQVRVVLLGRHGTARSNSRCHGWKRDTLLSSAGCVDSIRSCCSSTMTTKCSRPQEPKCAHFSTPAAHRVLLSYLLPRCCCRSCMCRASLLTALRWRQQRWCRRCLSWSWHCQRSCTASTPSERLWKPRRLMTLATSSQTAAACNRCAACTTVRAERCESPVPAVWFQSTMHAECCPSTSAVPAGSWQ